MLFFPLAYGDLFLGLVYGTVAVGVGVGFHFFFFLMKLFPHFPGLLFFLLIDRAVVIAVGLRPEPRLLEGRAAGLFFSAQNTAGIKKQSR